MKKFSICLITFSAVSFAYNYTEIDSLQSRGLQAILMGAKEIATQNSFCAEKANCPLGAYKYPYSEEGALNLFDFVKSFYDYWTVGTSVTETLWKRGELRGLSRYSTRALSRRMQDRVSAALLQVFETNYAAGRAER